MSFSVTLTTKWADFDANIHMRHTAYNDYAAEARIRFFKSRGITIKDFTTEKIGPILFEENTKFLKEIHIGEDITVNLKLVAVSDNKERWKIQNEIFNERGELSAIVTIYGAWLDLIKRKLTVPPEKFKSAFNNVEKTENFHKIITDKK